MDGDFDNRSDPFAATGGAPGASSDAGRAWAMPEAGLGDGDPVGPGIGGATIDDAPVHADRPRQEWNETRRDASGAVLLGPPPLPVALEPMTVPDLLDGAWAILKARPRTVLTITAVIIVPIELLSAALEHGATKTDLTSVLVAQPSGRSGALNGGLIGAAYLASALANLSYFFLGGALARLVSAWYGGGDLTAQDALLASLRKGHIFVAAWLLLLIPKSLSYCFVGLVAIPMFMLTAPAIMIEGLGPIAGALRSWRLVSRRFAWCVGVWLLSWLIEWAVNTMLSSIPGSLASLNIPGAGADFLVPAFAAFSKLVTAPFVVGVCVLMYLDLRVRTEGLDLELEATEAFARAS